MKKCTSCTKDLPDAALHCVFCGAKQAAAPAAPPSNAKTVMGYSAGDLVAQLQAQGGQLPPGFGGNAPAPAPAPMPMPTPAQQMGVMPTLASPPQPAPMPMQPAPMPMPMPQAPAPSPHSVPTAASQARTMFVDNGPPMAAPAPANNYGTPASQLPTMGAGMPPMGGQPMGGPGPMDASGMKTIAAGAPISMPGGVGPGASNLPPAPSGGFPGMAPPPAPMPMPMPGAMPNQGMNNPYASMGPSRGMTPSDPFRGSLQMMMLLFGGLLVLAFCVPLRTDPMVFNWNVVLDAPGTAKIAPLLIGGGGLLALIFGALPMATVPRAIVALVVGLAGVLVPTLLHDIPGWTYFASTLGYMMIVIGLAIRGQFHDSIMPRLVTTIGVVAVLAPQLIPTDYGIPLLAMFKALTAGGDSRILVLGILGIVGFLLVLASLLVWIPGGSGGATAILWCILAFPLVVFLVGMAVAGGFGEIGRSPAILVAWATGGGEHGGGGMPVAFTALLAYGGAATFGKALA